MFKCVKILLIHVYSVAKGSHLKIELRVTDFTETIYSP